jgi:hypothetical protein
MKTLTSLFAVSMMALVTTAGGCGTDDGTAPLNETTMTGKVGGQPWTFAAGHTSAFLSEGEPDFFATLHPMAFTACGFSEPSGNHLIVALPKAPGEYEMSLSRNMTFVVGSDNKIAIDGHIAVTEVTATKLKGGIAAKFDSQNEINGTFEISICPED